LDYNPGIQPAVKRFGSKIQEVFDDVPSRVVGRIAEAVVAVLLPQIESFDIRSGQSFASIA